MAEMVEMVLALGLIIVLIAAIFFGVSIAGGLALFLVVAVAIALFFKYKLAGMIIIAILVGIGLFRYLRGKAKSNEEGIEENVEDGEKDNEKKDKKGRGLMLISGWLLVVIAWPALMLYFLLEYDNNMYVLSFIPPLIGIVLVVKALD